MAARISLPRGYLDTTHEQALHTLDEARRLAENFARLSDQCVGDGIIAAAEICERPPVGVFDAKGAGDFDGGPGSLRNPAGGFPKCW